MAREATLLRQQAKKLRNIGLGQAQQYEARSKALDEAAGRVDALETNRHALEQYLLTEAVAHEETKRKVAFLEADLDLMRGAVATAQDAARYEGSQREKAEAECERLRSDPEPEELVSAARLRARITAAGGKVFFGHAVRVEAAGGRCFTASGPIREELVEKAIAFVEALAEAAAAVREWRGEQTVDPLAGKTACDDCGELMPDPGACDDPRCPACEAMAARLRIQLAGGRTFPCHHRCCTSYLKPLGMCYVEGADGKVLMACLTQPGTVEMCAAFAESHSKSAPDPKPAPTPEAAALARIEAAGGTVDVAPNLVYSVWFVKPADGAPGQDFYSTMDYHFQNKWYDRAAAFAEAHRAAPVVSEPIHTMDVARQLEVVQFAFPSDKPLLSLAQATVRAIANEAGRLTPDDRITGVAPPEQGGGE